MTDSQKIKNDSLIGQVSEGKGLFDFFYSGNPDYEAGFAAYRQQEMVALLKGAAERDEREARRATYVLDPEEAARREAEKRRQTQLAQQALLALEHYRDFELKVVGERSYSDFLGMTDEQLEALYPALKEANERIEEAYALGGVSPAGADVGHFTGVAYTPLSTVYKRRIEKPTPRLESAARELGHPKRLSIWP